MQIKTYRARSLKDALRMVQSELGPDARIVQTREVETRWWDRFARGRQFEIRTRRPGPQPLPLRRRLGEEIGHTPQNEIPDAELSDAEDFRRRVLTHLRDSQIVVEATPPLDEPFAEANGPMDASTWFDTLTTLIEAEVPQNAARELIEQVRSAGDQALQRPLDQQQALVDQLSREIHTWGPIIPTPGQRRVVALMGPTGVGKTTTIAKLAANFRLRERRSVGLITVDTYRVAAVEQLRTYAEIMDLPMEVVATPREMSAALARLADQELVLIDTAGHSPRDDVQLQKLKSLLSEAQADEVHLVVSAVSSASQLEQIVSRFAPLGASAVVITKLDEATSLGPLLPILRHNDLAVSYLTCGQNVPDDILVAEQNSLISVLLGHQPISAIV